MRRTILLVILILFLGFRLEGKPKNKHFYVGIKNNVGKSFYSYFVENKEKKAFTKLDNGFSNLSYFTFGGVVSNFNINSEIGYLYSVQNINIKRFIVEETDPLEDLKDSKTKYHFIVIPLEVNYRINLLKQKLYLNIGTGISGNIILKSKYVAPNYDPSLAILSNNIQYTNEIKKYANIFSLSVDARLGFLYNINDRLDVYTNFEYSNMITGLMKPKYHKLYYDVKRPYFVGCAIGLNVKF